MACKDAKFCRNWRMGTKAVAVPTWDVSAPFETGKFLASAGGGSEERSTPEEDAVAVVMATIAAARLGIVLNRRRRESSTVFEVVVVGLEATAVLSSPLLPSSASLRGNEDRAIILVRISMGVVSVVAVVSGVVDCGAPIVVVV